MHLHYSRYKPNIDHLTPSSLFFPFFHLSPSHPISPHLNLPHSHRNSPPILKPSGIRKMPLEKKNLRQANETGGGQSGGKKETCGCADRWWIKGCNVNANAMRRDGEGEGEGIGI